MSAKEFQPDIKGELLRRKSIKSSKGNQYTLQQSSQVKSSKKWSEYLIKFISYISSRTKCFLLTVNSKTSLWKSYKEDCKN